MTGIKCHSTAKKKKAMLKVSFKLGFKKVTDSAHIRAQFVPESEHGNKKKPSHPVFVP